MSTPRFHSPAFPAPNGGGAEQSLRNRIAARMLLAGLLPVAAAYGLRYLWKEGLGMPEEHLSYQIIAASLVLVLSASLASLCSRWMLLLLRGRGDAAAPPAEDASAGLPGQGAHGKSDGSERGAAFDCLLEAGSDAVVLVDHGRGVVRGASRRFREIFGFDGDGPEALAYSEVKTRVAARFENPERFAETWTRLATSGARMGGESWRTAGAEGRELVVFSERLPAGEVGGDEAARLWIFIDITEEVALRSALCRAERLESVGALVGGLAHDFNNLLTGVIGNLALAGIEVDEGRGSEAGRAYLERAKCAGMRAAELARHLVGYACVSGGGRRQIDLAAVLLEVERLVRPGLDSRLAFRVEVEDRIGSIVGDAGEIELVLVNLCVDAREALRGRDDGEIVLAARAAVETPGRVELLVRDNRAGRPAKVPPTSAEILRRHGGTLSLEAGAGGGTIFRVSLPRAGEKEAEAVGCPDGRTVGAYPRDGRGRETILIVDDEEVVRMVGEKMLLHRGYTVWRAADGQDALDRYDASPFEIDAVLLDLTMPGLSGAATFRMLKERDAALPVIVCSGYEVDADTFEAENGWCPDGILRKPFDIDGLAREVRRVLDAHVGLVLDAGA